ncbi:hypothetical protein BC827DRAFT_1385714 [Russula dissimulans]|nr:hypothetical protein BC827DRAFT_1385714 [Russula dissimulans]
MVDVGDVGIVAIRGSVRSIFGTDTRYLSQDAQTCRPHRELRTPHGATDEAPKDKEDIDEETVEVKKLVIVWTGALPKSTSATAAYDAAHVLALLRAYQIINAASRI